VISLRFESGTVVRVEILPTAGMVEESYEFFGEGCRARVTAGSGHNVRSSVGTTANS
jgi:hypothetical protein